MLLNCLFANTITIGKLTIKCRSSLFVAFGKDSPIGSPLKAGICPENKRSLGKLTPTPDFQLGEFYMPGALEIARGNLSKFLNLCSLNWADFGRNRRSRMWRGLSSNWMHSSRGNSRFRSHHNVPHHYDLSKALHRLLLNEDLRYSCAYFAVPGMPLDNAQRVQKEHTAAKLLLKKGQRVLNIGSGRDGPARLAQRGASQATVSRSLPRTQCHSDGKSLTKGHPSENVEWMVRRSNLC